MPQVRELRSVSGGIDDRPAPLHPGHADPQIRSTTLGAPRHITPLAVSDANAARMFDMKVREFREAVNRGWLPPPVVIAGNERWRVSDLTAILDGSAARPGHRRRLALPCLLLAAGLGLRRLLSVDLLLHSLGPSVQVGAPGGGACQSCQ